MAKKIRFPLKLAEETEVRTLEELREHFDLQAVLEYYKNGKLLTWLDDRYLEGEAEAIRALDEAAPDFQQRLCSVFQVEYTGAGVDMEEIERRQERLKRLRTITDEAEYIQNIDMVAFDQEELADLLDEGQSTIYLCGEKFTVPASRKGITYVGINEPAVHISGKVPETAEELEIVFTGITCDNLPEVTADRTASRAKAQSQPKTFGRSQTIQGAAASVSTATGKDNQPTQFSEDDYINMLIAEFYRLNYDSATGQVINFNKDFTKVKTPSQTMDGTKWTLVRRNELAGIWEFKNAADESVVVSVMALGMWRTYFHRFDQIRNM